jgi:hypothetical protein
MSSITACIPARIVRKPPTSNRAPQRLAITDQLVEITCSPWDLGDHPVTDRSTQCRHVHLQEEVAERGIRWWAPELLPKHLGENAVMPASETLQITQALAATQDSQHSHQQQVPSRKANAPPHARVRDRLEVANQFEIGCGRGGFRHKAGAIPLSSAHVARPGQCACDTL